MHASGERYQNTCRGKFNHAKRQKYYRERERKKVTHHPSNEIPVNDLLQPKVNESVNTIYDNEIRCHFCDCSCGSSLRIAFLSWNRESASGVWPLGP